MVRRWVPALVLGGAWWWAVLRLVLEPEHAGLVEGAVAAGGWGLSLLPVHVAATVPQDALPGRIRAHRVVRGVGRRLFSGASPSRRSGGGSGPS